MYGRTNAGGGSGKTFAVISVIYPEGSICTCSDGSRTLKAKNTSGSVLFLVPHAATWTVAATDGAETASETVNITAEGQTVSVELNYSLWLYKSGDECVTVTGGWQGRGWASSSSYQPQMPEITRTETYISVKKTASTSYNYSGVLETVNDIDLTDFNTLFVDCLIVANNENAWSAVRIVDRSGTYITSIEYAAVNLKEATTRKTLSLDISSINGAADVVVSVAGQSAPEITATVYNMWLE